MKVHFITYSDEKYKDKQNSLNILGNQEFNQVHSYNRESIINTESNNLSYGKHTPAPEVRYYDNQYRRHLRKIKIKNIFKLNVFIKTDINPYQ